MYDILSLYLDYFLDYVWTISWSEDGKVYNFTNMGKKVKYNFQKSLLK